MIVARLHHCYCTFGDCKAYRDKVREAEEQIIKSNVAEAILLFAVNIVGADVNKLQEAIIKTGNAYRIFQFATDVENADYKRLMDIVESLIPEETDEIEDGNNTTV